MFNLIDLRGRFARVFLTLSLLGISLAFGPAAAWAESLMLAQATEPATTPAPTVAPAIESQGEELFGRNCQLCHNSRGKGGKAPQLLRGAWGPGGANSDEFMFNTIKNGRPNTPMGGWIGALSEAEIWVIIGFLRAESLRAKASDRKKVKDDYVPF